MPRRIGEQYAISQKCKINQRDFIFSHYDDGKNEVEEAENDENIFVDGMKLFSSCRDILMCRAERNVKCEQKNPFNATTGVHNSLLCCDIPLH